ncbi:hypothetical protein [Spirosoma aerophilum]
MKKRLYKSLLYLTIGHLSVVLLVNVASVFSVDLQQQWLINHYCRWFNVAAYDFFSPDISNSVDADFTLTFADSSRTRTKLHYGFETQNKVFPIYTHFANDSASREWISRSLATRMFERYPQAMGVRVNLYMYFLPTQAEYRQGKSLESTLFASYPFYLH